MKPLVAGLAALALALTLGLSAPAPAQADPVGGAVPQHVLPAAPSKTTKPKPKPKPSATPTPSPSVTATPRGRTAADEEGERWVQLAMVAGGGLLGAVALFFGIGALLRRRPRPRG
jgi:pyruvate/2-oxoglutarate dehydrogenase complex dihydrolipoamide acyltransferase (E2) component